MSPVGVGPGINLSGPVTGSELHTAPGVGGGISIAPTVASGTVMNVPKTIVETIIAENFYYEHVQSTPSADWTIHHNLGKKPNISVFDSDGGEVLIEVHHLDENTAYVNWPGPTTGTAYCS